MNQLGLFLILWTALSALFYHCHASDGARITHAEAFEQLEQLLMPQPQRQESHANSDAVFRRLSFEPQPLPRLQSVPSGGTDTERLFHVLSDRDKCHEILGFPDYDSLHLRYPTQWGKVEWLETSDSGIWFDRMDDALVSIESINWNESGIQKVDWRALSRMNALRKLNLDKNPLTGDVHALPPNLWKLKLRDNILESMSAWLPPSLTHVYVTDKIITLPVQWDRMPKHLQVLQIKEEHGHYQYLYF